MHLIGPTMIAPVVHVTLNMHDNRAKTSAVVADQRSLYCLKKRKPETTWLNCSVRSVVQQEIGTDNDVDDWHRAAQLCAVLLTYIRLLHFLLWMRVARQ